MSAGALNADAVRAALPPGRRNIRLEIHPEIDSTNTRARALAEAGAAAGTAVLAEHQTAGRGRLGRSFYSPAATGLYLSVILRPGGILPDTQPATVTAAVAVCRALEKALPGIRPQIKWVNDIFIGGRKVCGILAEGVCARGEMQALVMGIGVNVSTAAFPPELQNTAAALPGGETVDRNLLAVEIINTFLSLSDNNTDPAVRRETLAEYRRRSLALGREVSFTERGETVYATAEDIDETGCLLVRRADGRRERLHSGEISIKL